MTINLYQCNAEYNRVNKSSYITGGVGLEGAFRDESDSINPVITIQWSNPVVQQYNYAYIPEFARWYFVNEWRSIRNGIWELHLHVDVLFTWGVDIRNALALLERTSSPDQAELYLSSNGMASMAKHQVRTAAFSNGFDDHQSLVLICAGGEGSGSN